MTFKQQVFIAILGVVGIVIGGVINIFPVIQDNKNKTINITAKDSALICASLDGLVQITEQYISGVSISPNHEVAKTESITKSVSERIETSVKYKYNDFYLKSTSVVDNLELTSYRIELHSIDANLNKSIFVEVENMKLLTSNISYEKLKGLLYKNNIFIAGKLVKEDGGTFAIVNIDYMENRNKFRSAVGYGL